MYFMLKLFIEQKDESGKYVIVLRHCDSSSIVISFCLGLLCVLHCAVGDSDSEGQFNWGSKDCL